MVKAPAATVLCNNPDKGTLIIAAVKAGPKPRVEAPRAHVGVQKLGLEEEFNIVILWQFAAPYYGTLKMEAVMSVHLLHSHTSHV
jgi:hypothetical protein